MLARVAMVTAQDVVSMATPWWWFECSRPLILRPHLAVSVLVLSKGRMALNADYVHSHALICVLACVCRFWYARACEHIDASCSWKN